MIPIGDSIPGERFPLVTYLIIALNAVVFLFEVSLGPYAEAFIRHWGLVPSYFVHHIASSHAWLTIFTAMYLHGGWEHIVGNMLYLWIFGNNVEDRMGHVGYFVFYTVSGVAAALMQVAVDPTSTVPTIGASGAIAGVLGAYLLLYPHAEIYFLVFFFVFVTTISLPAVIVLMGWFLMQLAYGMSSWGLSMGGGVAWWAHVGGFLTGMLLTPLFIRRRHGPFRRLYGGPTWVERRW